MAQNTLSNIKKSQNDASELAEMLQNMTNAEKEKVMAYINGYQAGKRQGRANGRKNNIRC